MGYNSTKVIAGRLAHAIFASVVRRSSGAWATKVRRSFRRLGYRGLHVAHL